jgi:hypothetical protein
LYDKDKVAILWISIPAKNSPDNFLS